MVPPNSETPETGLSDSSHPVASHQSGQNLSSDGACLLAVRWSRNVPRERQGLEKSAQGAWEVLRWVPPPESLIDVTRACQSTDSEARRGASSRGKGTLLSGHDQHHGFEVQTATETHAGAPEQTGESQGVREAAQAETKEANEKLADTGEGADEKEKEESNKEGDESVTSTEGFTVLAAFPAEERSYFQPCRLAIERLREEEGNDATGDTRHPGHLQEVSVAARASYVDLRGRGQGGNDMERGGEQGVSSEGKEGREMRGRKVLQHVGNAAVVQEAQDAIERAEELQCFLLPPCFEWWADFVSEREEEATARFSASSCSLPRPCCPSLPFEQKSDLDGDNVAGNSEEEKLDCSHAPPTKRIRSTRLSDRLAPQGKRVQPTPDHPTSAHPADAFFTSSRSRGRGQAAASSKDATKKVPGLKDGVRVLVVGRHEISDVTADCRRWLLRRLRFAEHKKHSYSLPAEERRQAAGITLPSPGQPADSETRASTGEKSTDEAVPSDSAELSGEGCCQLPREGGRAAEEKEGEAEQQTREDQGGKAEEKKREVGGGKQGGSAEREGRDDGSILETDAIGTSRERREDENRDTLDTGRPDARLSPRLMHGNCDEPDTDAQRQNPTTATTSSSSSLSPAGSQHSTSGLAPARGRCGSRVLFHRLCRSRAAVSAGGPYGCAGRLLLRFSPDATSCCLENDKRFEVDGDGREPSAGRPDAGAWCSSEGEADPGGAATSPVAAVGGSYKNVSQRVVFRASVYITRCVEFIVRILWGLVESEDDGMGRAGTEGLGRKNSAFFSSGRSFLSGCLRWHLRGFPLHVCCRSVSPSSSTVCACGPGHAVAVLFVLSPPFPRESSAMCFFSAFLFVHYFHSRPAVTFYDTAGAAPHHFPRL